MSSSSSDLIKNIPLQILPLCDTVMLNQISLLTQNNSNKSIISCSIKNNLSQPSSLLVNMIKMFNISKNINKFIDLFYMYLNKKERMPLINNSFIYCQRFDQDRINCERCHIKPIYVYQKTQSKTKKFKMRIGWILVNSRRT